jgi:hypothetical protein
VFSRVSVAGVPGTTERVLAVGDGGVREDRPAYASEPREEDQGKRERVLSEICEALEGIRECIGVDIVPILRTAQASRAPSPMVVPRTDEGKETDR